MQVLGMASDERNFKYLNNQISFGFALFFNILLLICVLTRTANHLKPYKKVLICYIFVDFCFAFTNWLFYPLYINFQYEGVMYTGQVLWGVWDDIRQPGTSIVMLISSFFRNYYSCVVAVHFVYRYCIICHNHQLHWWSFGTLCLLTSTGPLAYSVLSFEAQLEEESLKEGMRTLFADTDWTEDRGSIPEFAAMSTEKNTPLNLITPITAGISYFVIVVCSILMSRRMRSLRRLQVGTASKAHSQLMRVLTVQALVPLISSVVPTVLLQSTRVAGLSSPGFVRTLFILNPWSPVMNPLCAILFITPYRRFVLRPFGKPTVSSEHSHPSERLHKLNQGVSRVFSRMLKIVG